MGKDKKRRRHSRSTSRKRHSSDETSLSRSDLTESELVKLKPIGGYMNDRTEMVNQMFTSLRHGDHLKSIMPDILKTVPLDELKQMCIEELEGMSKKRIRCILAGEDMLSSSGTDESSSEDEEGTLVATAPAPVPRRNSPVQSESNDYPQPDSTSADPEPTASKCDQEVDTCNDGDIDCNDDLELEEPLVNIVLEEPSPVNSPEGVNGVEGAAALANEDLSSTDEVVSKSTGSPEELEDDKEVEDAESDKEVEETEDDKEMEKVEDDKKDQEIKNGEAIEEPNEVIELSSSEDSEVEEGEVTDSSSDSDLSSDPDLSSDRGSPGIQDSSKTSFSPRNAFRCTIPESPTISKLPTVPGPQKIPEQMNPDPRAVLGSPKDPTPDATPASPKNADPHSQGLQDDHPSEPPAVSLITPPLSSDGSPCEQILVQEGNDDITQNAIQENADDANAEPVNAEDVDFDAALMAQIEEHDRSLFGAALGEARCDPIVPESKETEEEEEQLEFLEEPIGQSDGNGKKTNVMKSFSWSRQASAKPDSVEKNADCSGQEADDGIEHYDDDCVSQDAISSSTDELLPPGFESISLPIKTTNSSSAPATTQSNSDPKPTSTTERKTTGILPIRTLYYQLKQHRRLAAMRKSMKPRSFGPQPFKRVVKETPKPAGPALPPTSADTSTSAGPSDVKLPEKKKKKSTSANVLTPEFLADLEKRRLEYECEMKAKEELLGRLKAQRQQLNMREQEMEESLKRKLELGLFVPSDAEKHEPPKKEKKIRKVVEINQERSPTEKQRSTDWRESADSRSLGHNRSMRDSRSVHIRNSRIDHQSSSKDSALADTRHSCHEEKSPLRMIVIGDSRQIHRGEKPTPVTNDVPPNRAEILELELRAKAIRSLMKATDGK